MNASQMFLLPEIIQKLLRYVFRLFTQKFRLTATLISATTGLRDKRDENTPNICMKHSRSFPKALKYSMKVQKIRAVDIALSQTNSVNTHTPISNRFVL
jgi:hypothetical protein